MTYNLINIGWWPEVIACASGDLSFVMFCSIHPSAISQFQFHYSVIHSECPGYHFV